VAAAIGVALLGVITACGASSTPPSSAPVIKASHAKPRFIIPTPADTLDGTYPEPNGSMWVLAGSPASHGIYTVDLSTKKLTGSVSVSNDAKTVAESPTGILALGLATATTGAVEFLNGSTGAPLKTVPVSGPVVSIAAGDDGVTFYVLNGNTQAKTVAILNAQTGKLDGTIAAPADAVGVVPAPNEESVFVLEPNGVVSQIATTGGHILTQFPIGNSGLALALSPNGQTLYALKGQGSVENVAVVNVAKESVTRVLPAPADTEAITLSPDGQILYDIVGAPGLGNIQGFALS
jgi:DNA-binding beta-propeller fold protein YncE